MISYHTDKVQFSLKDKPKNSKWLERLLKSEKFNLLDLNYVFTSDEALHKINLEYLKHDTFTDVITFDNSDESNLIEGDIFISIERVSENAQTLQIDFDTELRRVMAHGLLHLCGYKDKTIEEVNKMRKMEEWALSIW